MTRRLIWILLLVTLWLSPAVAQTDFTAPIIERLQEDGYTISDVRRTLLGRILIVANKRATLREVVINRKTGAILHDHIFATSTMPSTSETISTPPGVPNGPSAPDPDDMGGGIGSPGGPSGGIGGGGFGN